MLVKHPLCSKNGAPSRNSKKPAKKCEDSTLDTRIFVFRLPQNDAIPKLEGCFWTLKSNHQTLRKEAKKNRRLALGSRPSTLVLQEIKASRSEFFSDHGCVIHP